MKEISKSVGEESDEVSDKRTLVIREEWKDLQEKNIGGLLLEEIRLPMMDSTDFNEDEWVKTAYEL